MAKTVIKRSNSRIRFVMLEADLGGGDLTEVTQAISSALRQAQPGQRFISAPARAEANDGGIGAEATDELDLTEGEQVREVDATPRSAKPRRVVIPKVLEVDLKSGDKPFEEFAAKKAPSSDLSRHLVVAYWFKKYRSTDSVTADHAFTCYKKAGWPTNLADFAQPFRDLSRASKGTMKAGSFTINQIGEDAVEKLGTE